MHALSPGLEQSAEQQQALLTNYHSFWDLSWGHLKPSIADFSFENVDREAPSNYKVFVLHSMARAAARVC